MEILRYSFSFNGSNTSSQVATYTSTAGSNDELKYTYTYDGNGNITKITCDGKEIRYVYDDLGQLIREDNAVRNQTYVYTYDKAGNILSKRTYALTAAGSTPTSPTSTNTYGYNNANWGDLLTSFNGNAITYDAIGNPLSYNNGSQYSFEWSGRRLTKSTLPSTGTVTYTYNDEGIRTSKNVSGTEHRYSLSGSQIVSETWGSYLFVYLYDADGSPIGMQCRVKNMAEGQFYTLWFEKNLQGDIVAVYDDAGNKLYSYTYDAWGNCVATRHSTSTAARYAQYNPFRYRGYYYDSETGFYYLQSRYYDPHTGRFLNADTITDGGAGILGNNLFIYAANNPVNNSDPSGHWLIKDALKWVLKNVARPAVETSKVILSNFDLTVSKGKNINLSPSIFGFSGQIGVSVDTKGNISLQGSVCGGLTTGTPGAALASYVAITNAPSTQKLNGDGYQLGWSAAALVYGVPLLGGSDVNFIPDAEFGKTYYGTTSNVGFGTPGGEVHAEWGRTWTLLNINIFDILESAYIAIMES